MTLHCDLCHDAEVIENVLWLLTGLAGVVVLLTRMRLGAAQRHAGHAQIPALFVAAHTVVGVLALAAWVAYLVSVNDLLGWVSIALWWLEVVVGLLILARWMPGAGSHAADTVEDSWTQGPALSILGHVGLLVGVVFFTYCVVAGQV